MPKDAPRKSLHFFNAGEVSRQKKFAILRQKLFRPILIVLTSLGVQPDVLTAAGILSMALLPLSFLYAIPSLSIAAYALHFFFDALDGPLARHRKLTSPAGAYGDIVADHFSLVATALTLLWFGIGDPFWLTLYTVGYLLVIVHMVLLNVRTAPLPFPILRARYPLFILTVFTAYGWNTLPILNLFLGIVGIYYALMLLLSVLRLRWSLRS